MHRDYQQVFLPANFTSIARSNGALLRSNGHSLSLRTDSFSLGLRIGALA